MMKLFDLAKRHFLNGLEAFQSASYEVAETEFRESLRYLPDRPSTLVNLQAVLVKLNKLDEALKTGQYILEIEPTSAEAHLNIGYVYKAQGDWVHAHKFFSQAITLNPESEEGWNNLGIAKLEIQDFAAAELDFQKALTLNPKNPDTYNNIGILYKELRRFDDAIEALQTSIRLRPVNPDAYNNLGNVYLELQRNMEALEAFEKALSFNHGCPDIYYNIGNAFSELKQFDNALSAYARASSIKADISWLPGRLLLTMAKLCEWENFKFERARLLEAVEAGRQVIVPFDALCIASSSKIQKRSAEIYVDRITPGVRSETLTYNHKKIRIGYLSFDYRDHAVSYLMMGVWRNHDSNRFEIYGFDLGGYDQSFTRQKVVNSFYKFYDVSRLSDEDVARFIRSNEIDILVDLVGHTRGARTSILAHRPAPIQVNYLGFPGTMGAPSFVDYIVADLSVIPSGSEAFYSEKIVYLPDCFQANDSERLIGTVRERSIYGLPRQGLVFASFAHAAKMNPEVFEAWLSILKEVPGSVLWLIREHVQQEQNLRSFAEIHGVSPDRLVFSGILPYPEHLARYKVVDLVLDTMPFNGGTTTSDALWAGAPVLTCVGESFAGRMTTSLLRTLSLQELVVESIDDYKALAIDLARHPEKLVAIRQKLAENRSTAALFDTPRFTRNLEVAYEAIWARHQACLMPDHIHVQA